MRLFTPSLTALSLAAALAAGPAMAHTQVYSASLLGSSEIPAAATPATGWATVTLDLDTLMMRVQFSFSDLIGHATASHIHCCTVTPGGSNVGVATMTPSFTGFSFSGTSGPQSGSYDHTFDMSLASSYNASFIVAKGGTVGLAFNALVAGLDSGNAYLNLHTSSFPGGEIRALLAPVPEPATYGLMLGGLGLLALRRRR